MVKYINDIAGVRLICSFTSDIYRLAAMIGNQSDLKVEDNDLVIKLYYDKRMKNLKGYATKVGEKLSNIFKFCEDVFGDGQEMLILVTELTISYYGAHFISRYGCEEYFKHNKELLFYERQQEITMALKEVDLKA